MKHARDQRGTILLVFIIVLPFLILIATYFMQLSVTSFQVARFDELHTQAQLAADAGADYATEQIAQDNTWAGTGGEIQLHSDSTTRTTYDVTVTNGTGIKTLSVIGRTYWPATATTASRKVAIYVDLRPVSSGSYSVVSGSGGLYMSNSAKVVGGDVLINGEISLANSSQIGLSTTPVTVKVANQVCPIPADATYPRVCNSGEGPQPISINNQAHIYGTVIANNQTDGSGMSNPGLTSGSVAPQALPTYDRAAQKAAVTNSIGNGAASCSGTQTMTWPANTKISGNVTVAGKCVVTVAGNVWITGTLTLTQSAKLVVADSAGATSPVIMIDGLQGASFGNSSALVSNVSHTGFEVITYYSTAACSPDCTSVTGTDLANSRGLTTISLNNTGASAETIFYAYWTQVQVLQSGSLGAIIGQTIQISNTGTITFGSSTGTGTVVWVVKGYRRQ